MVQAERFAGIGEAGQFVVVGREQAAAAVLSVHGLGHSPGERKAVIGRGASPNLVEDDKAALRSLAEDSGGFDHFDHESGTATGKVVRCADPAEQAVDQGRSWLRPRARNRPPAPAGTISAFWRRNVDFPPMLGPPSSQSRSSRAEVAIIGNEPLALRSQRRFDYGMPAALNGKHGFGNDVRQAPTALCCALGLPGGDIDPGERLGRFGDGEPRGESLADQLLEMRFFCRERVPASLGDAAGFPRAGQPR